MRADYLYCMMYNEHDEPERCRFYCGPKGRMPRIGEAVTVRNALTDVDQPAVVCELLRSTREFRVKLVSSAQLGLNLPPAEGEAGDE